MDRENIEIRAKREAAAMQTTIYVYLNSNNGEHCITDTPAWWRDEVPICSYAPDGRRQQILAHVKCRKDGEKGWWFMGTEGRMTRLRVHAVEFKAENVRQLAEELKQMNPAYEFKTVLVDKDMIWTAPTPAPAIA